MYTSIISGMGSYVPKNILTNFALENLVDTSDEWIRQRTGIRERRVVTEEQVTSDLAVLAGRSAIEDSGLDKEMIDCVIVATNTPDHIFPPVACLVQSKLGLGKVAGFDVSATCTGFITALSVADQYIKTGKYKNILVIGAETLSKIVNWQDRGTCILFGDGAGAFVLSRLEEEGSRGIIYTDLKTNGEHFYQLLLPAGGVKEPINESALRNARNKIHMCGNKIFRLAVNAMVEIAKDSLRESQLTLDKVDWVIPHQANERIIEAVAKGLDIPSYKLIKNIERYGNNSTASIPLAIDINYRRGVIKKGDIMLCVAFGGGLTWGSLIVQF